MSDVWLLVKRGLYYRPNDCGYTGIRDHAVRYSGDEARAKITPGASMVRAESAPEFSDACFDSLARDHLRKQRDEARAENERLRGLLMKVLDEDIPMLLAQDILKALDNEQSKGGKR